MLIGGGRFRFMSCPLYRYVLYITSAVPKINIKMSEPPARYHFAPLTTYIRCDPEVKEPNTEQEAQNNRYRGSEILGDVVGIIDAHSN